MKIEKEFIMKNKLGMHARPAAMFVQLANKFKSDINISKGDDVVNGKSIMGILTLAAEQGSKLKINIDGPDAEEMLKEVELFFQTNFEV